MYSTNYGIKSNASFSSSYELTAKTVKLYKQASNYVNASINFPSVVKSNPNLNKSFIYYKLTHTYGHLPV